MTLGTGLTRDRSNEQCSGLDRGVDCRGSHSRQPRGRVPGDHRGGMLIDALMEAGMAPDCALAAGSTGWVLFRRILSHPEEAPDREAEQELDEAATGQRSVQAKSAAGRPSGERMVRILFPPAESLVRTMRLSVERHFRGHVAVV